MNTELDRKFPVLADIEKAALRPLSRLMADYTRCGMGDGALVYRNLDGLAEGKFLPRYAQKVAAPDLSTGLAIWQ